jgi:protein-tyrosine phosphatase
MDRIPETRCGAGRAVRWEGFYNARDLGGLPTVTGSRTRHGRLIRSADVRFVTAAGWQAARDAGIRVVIDLRNPDEATATARPADVQTVLIPLDDIEDLDLWRRLNSEGLNGTPLYYRPFLDAKPERAAAVRTAIARVADAALSSIAGPGATAPG